MATQHEIWEYYYQGEHWALIRVSPVELDGKPFPEWPKFREAVMGDTFNKDRYRIGPYDNLPYDMLIRAKPMERTEEFSWFDRSATQFARPVDEPIIVLAGVK